MANPREEDEMTDCKHEWVTVRCREVILQDYDRTTKEWDTDFDLVEVESIDQVLCSECGADLTAELADELYANL